MVRIIFFIAFSFAFLASSGKSIYVNNDNAATNPGSYSGDGSQGSPWSFQRLQDEFKKGSASAILPGDFVLLNKGQTYYGALLSNISGTPAAPIFVTTYGTGASPTLSGFTRLTAFFGGSGGLYTSLPFSSLSSCKTVYINGELIPPGRFPSADNIKGNETAWGWSRSTNTGTTGSLVTRLSRYSRAQAQSLIGSVAIVRTSRWTIDSVRIGGFTVSEDPGSTDSVLTFTYSKGKTQYAHPSGYGFFFIGRKEFCDIDKEWSFDPDAKTLSVNLSGTPSSYEIKASSVDNVVTIQNSSNLIFDGVNIEGANFDGIKFLGTCDRVFFTNGNISFCGSKAVNAHLQNNVSNVSITNANIFDIGNFGVDHREAGNSWIVSYNNFERIGQLPGLAVVDVANQSCAIRGGGNGTRFHKYEGNTFDVIGYSAIRYNGDYTYIRGNKIKNICHLLDDTGGIYTAKSTSKDSSIIENNFVDGRITGNPLQGAGINNSLAGYDYYFDDESGGEPGREIFIINNIGINAPRSGLYIHNGHNFRIYGNTFYNNGESQIQIVTDRNSVTNTYTVDDTAHNIFVKHNKFISTSTATAQEIAKFFTINNTASALTKLDELTGTGPTVNLNNGIDSNFYSKPFHPDPDKVYAIWNYSNTNPVAERIDLATWYSRHTHDKNSLTSPVKFAGTTRQDTAVLFFYNIGNGDTVVNLSKSYKNEAGEIVYPGTLTLKPYETAVLYRFEATAPTEPPPPTTPVETGIVGYRGPFAAVDSKGNKIKYGPYLVVTYEPVYRQNFFINSEALNNFSRGAAVSVATDNLLSPYDSLTAERFTALVSTSNLQHNIYQAGSTKKDTTYTLSVHVKQGTHRYFQIYGGTSGFGSGMFGNFDLEEGAVTLTGSGVSASGITPLKNGWFEVWITGKATASATSGVNNSFNLIDGPAATRARFYINGTATTLYLWGAQYATGEKRGYSKTTLTPIL